MMMNPYHKHVSVAYNISIVCKDEAMMYGPKPIDLVYKRISNDSMMITQQFDSLVPTKSD